MGAWSGKPFGNDAAQDLLYDYRALPPAERPEFLRRTLEEAAPNIPESATAGEESVAAAAIVVQSGGHVEGVVETGLDDPTLLVSADESRALAPLAKRALDLVLGTDSELRELWADTGESEWFESVLALRRALNRQAALRADGMTIEELREFVARNSRNPNSYSIDEGLKDRTTR